ncbi:hypothetical protein AB6A40_001589 [Gnathostoma spinigerum]|uniref:DEK-C domain-containing protein n=1 Tax=Gnathostoma spinigerum TaxID=75299 RepID=A0ABD6EEW9_9BILA
MTAVTNTGLTVIMADEKNIESNIDNGKTVAHANDSESEASNVNENHAEPTNSDEISPSEKANIPSMENAKNETMAEQSEVEEKKGSQFPEVNEDSAEDEINYGISKPEQSKTALLDSPLVIEGKRQRTSVSRLVATADPLYKRAKTAGAVGNGTPLGDIEFINFNLSKEGVDVLIPLHKICFGSPGTASMRKRDLRRFNGYPFSEETAEFQKKKNQLLKYTREEVSRIRRYFGLDRAASKEDEVMAILRFLRLPEDHGKKVPVSRKRGAKNRKRKKSDSRSAKKAKHQESDDENRTKSENSHASEDNAASGGEDSSAEQETRKKKEAPKKMELSRAGRKKQLKKAMIAIKKKRPDAKEKGTTPLSDEGTRQDDKDSGRWGQGGPTDEELNAAIHDLLHSVDLGQYTMKQMVQEIGEKFPKLNMEVHKSALKERVKTALNEMDGEA